MHGGKRIGSGRKRLPDYLRRVAYTLRLPKWIIQKLRKEDNATQLIEDAILKKTGWREGDELS